MIERFTITIELLYYPLTNGDIQRRQIQVPTDTDISSPPLPLFHAIGLAEWQDDQYGGMVVGEYKDCGVVEDGKAYCILSGDVEMTMKVMNKA